MRTFDSYSNDQIKSKFKPVSIKIKPWTFGPSIKAISHIEKNAKGYDEYFVKLQDGQVIKVTKNILSKNYINLFKDFETNSQKRQARISTRSISEKRHIEPIVFRSKKTRVSARLTNEIDSRKAGILRKRPPRKQLTQRKKSTTEYYEQNKRVRGRPLKTSKYVFDSDEDIDIDGDSDIDDSSTTGSKTEILTSTQCGRKVMKPDRFAGSSTRSLVKPPPKMDSGPTHDIPLYEDELFISCHSERCFRCFKPAPHNRHLVPNNIVRIGRHNSKARLLFCDFCSLSFHNNCVARLNINIDKDTGAITCEKCIKKLSCFGCANKKTVDRVYFRCLFCSRSYHKACIVSSKSSDISVSTEESDLNSLYRSGTCFDCAAHADKAPESMVSERIIDGKVEYLIKWKGKSFRKSEWVSESWISQIAHTLFRGYINKKQKNQLVSFSEDWLIIDRILDVEWENKARKEVRRVLAVFKDRDYDEATWDEPPLETDVDLYPDYKIALERYIRSMNVAPPNHIRHLVEQVRTKANAESYEKHELKSQPKFINGGTLMKHQMEALNWLIYQWEKEKPCVLADDMGLGKTIQIATFLYYLFKKFGIYPFFIVVPNSTATNWIREFQKWAPDFIVAPYFGSSVARKLSLNCEILNKQRQIKCHVVVTTYESAIENSELYKHFWPVMIVDESQRLKNDQSLLFKQLSTLKLGHTVLLTGTPLQNNLRELFNIMNFIHPSIFEGSEAENYENLTKEQVEELHSRLRPYFLRRTKEEVLKSLPPKYELIVPLTMTPLQKEIYKQCISGQIHETLSIATKAKRQKGLTSIFMNLRKVLNHPYLLNGVEAPQPTLEQIQENMINACGKLRLFHQMLPKLIEQGNRVLLFSTMTRALDVIEDYLINEKIQYARVDGNTKERDRVKQIDAYNVPNSEIKVFLLSTRAGGVGINLATADTVIIWDSDFNPYADAQAISRAHRFGQTKMVMIYRFITRFSVEEKILQIAKKRMALEHVIVERMNENEEERLEDIESILKYGTEALFSDDTSKDIVYDTKAIENLLNRDQYSEVAAQQQMDEVKELEGKAKEEGGTNFSFAKVWRADGTAEDFSSIEKQDEEQKDADFWEKFLSEQQKQAEIKKSEQLLEEMKYNRGSRKRAIATYNEKHMAQKSFEDDLEKAVEISMKDMSESGSVDNNVYPEKQAKKTKKETLKEAKDAARLARKKAKEDKLLAKLEAREAKLRAELLAREQKLAARARNKNPIMLKLTLMQKPQTENTNEGNLNLTIPHNVSQLSTTQISNDIEAATKFVLENTNRFVSGQSDQYMNISTNYKVDNLPLSSPQSSNSDGTDPKSLINNPMNQVPASQLTPEILNSLQEETEAKKPVSQAILDSSISNIEEIIKARKKEEEEQKKLNKDLKHILTSYKTKSFKDMCDLLTLNIKEIRENNKRDIATGNFSVSSFYSNLPNLKAKAEAHLVHQMTLKISEERDTDINNGVDSNIIKFLCEEKVLILSENVKRVLVTVNSKFNQLEKEVKKFDLEITKRRERIEKLKFKQYREQQELLARQAKEISDLMNPSDLEIYERASKKTDSPPIERTLPFAGDSLLSDLKKLQEGGSSDSSQEYSLKISTEKFKKNQAFQNTAQLTGENSRSPHLNHAGSSNTLPKTINSYQFASGNIPPKLAMKTTTLDVEIGNQLNTLQQIQRIKDHLKASSDNNIHY